MKTGRTLVQLATELERQTHAKKDYLAPAQKLAMAVSPGQSGEGHNLVLNGVNGGGMPLRAIAHGQLASTLGIPKLYYDRMFAERPELLAANVNTWLGKTTGKKLVRTLDNQVRAILSDSYRPLDNFDLAEAVLPSLQGLDADVISGEVTDARLYLKAVSPKIQATVAKLEPGTHNRVDDLIQAGIVISNSEVGQGSLHIQYLDYRLICTNGMIRETAVRRAHLGRKHQGDLESAQEFFTDTTRQASDKAFFLQVKDTVRGMFDSEKFNLRMNQYREAADQKLPANVDTVEVIDLVGKRFGLNEGERKSVLNHLIQGGDLSKWGLANAVTRAAQDDVLTYDRATELEGIGGDVIELVSSEWRTMMAV